MNNNDQSIINSYFDTLEDWKCLPAYKLEVRIDSIVGFALSNVIKDVMGYSVTTIIPELPLRVGTIYPNHEGKNDRSYKVDFYVLTECHKNLFIEFKFDSKSRNDKQNDYLKKAIERGMEEILKGIIRIASVNTYKKKYGYLLEKLKNFELVTRRANNFHATPRQSAIELIYIQPKVLKGDEGKFIIDYERLADSICKCYNGSAFMERFANSIRNWSSD